MTLMENMNKNPFKEMGNEDLPENMKRKVLTSVHLITLLGDFTELFTIKLAATISKMIDPLGSKKDNGDSSIHPLSDN